MIYSLRLLKNRERMISDLFFYKQIHTSLLSLSHSMSYFNEILKIKDWITLS